MNMHTGKPKDAAQLPLDKIEALKPGMSLVPQDAPQEKSYREPKDGKCWALPRQDRIEVDATTADTIELLQVSPMGELEDVRIDFYRTNAVAICRMILFAAGFSAVNIAAAVNGKGWYDLETGSIPEHFDGGGDK